MWLERVSEGGINLALETECEAKQTRKNWK